MNNQISDIQIIPIKPQNGLVGFASFILNDSFYMSSIGIITRPMGGYRLLYPTRKQANNNLSVFNPINKNTAEHVEQEVIKKFELTVSR